VPGDDADRAARLLLKALDSLRERDRRFVTAALLSSGFAIGEARQEGGAPATLEIDPRFGVQLSRQVDRPLLVRLPSDLHARLRRWATNHGFSMAGIVRGLVERFLDEQEGRPKRPR
jgi:hypothetical protein